MYIILLLQSKTVVGFLALSSQVYTNNQNKCSTYCPKYSFRHILGIHFLGQCCP